MKNSSRSPALRAAVLLSLTAPLFIACAANTSALDGAEASADTASADHLGFGGYGPPVVQLYLLQSNHYTDAFYATSPSTIVNPDGVWTPDGNVVSLFTDARACSHGRAVPVHQCQPTPHAYSHYVSQYGCFEGTRPTDIGTIGYVCASARGVCDYGTAPLYSGTNRGVTYAYPFVTGLAFSTTVLSSNLPTLRDNGEIHFAPVVELGCAPTAAYGTGSGPITPIGPGGFGGTITPIH